MNKTQTYLLSLILNKSKMFVKHLYTFIRFNKTIMVYCNNICLKKLILYAYTRNNNISRHTINSKILSI